MEPICKTIAYKPGDRKNRLVLITPSYYTALALLAFPIIAGLETYYKNRYGDPGSIYVGGFWTFVYGFWLVSAFIARREVLKRSRLFLERQEQEIKETVRFSDDAFETTVAGYYSSCIPWTSLSSFRDSKNYLQFTLTGVEFLISKKHFTQEEVIQIIALLRAKSGLPNKSVQSTEDNATESIYPRPRKPFVITRKARLWIIISIVVLLAICLLPISLGIFSGLISVGSNNNNRIAECNLKKTGTQVFNADSFSITIEDCFWKTAPRRQLSFSRPYIRTTERDILVLDMVITNQLSRELRCDCEVFDPVGRQLHYNPSSELFPHRLSPSETRSFRKMTMGFSSEDQDLSLICRSAVPEDNPLDEMVIRIQ